jgi:hypothetical protein
MAVGDVADLYPRTPWEDVTSVETMTSVELVKEAAQSLKSSREALAAATDERNNAEADFRYVFFDVLTEEERTAVVAEDAEVDQQLADINNGYRFGDRK